MADLANSLLSITGAHLPRGDFFELVKVRCLAWCASYVRWVSGGGGGNGTVRARACACVFSIERCIRKS